MKKIKPIIVDFEDFDLDYECDVYIDDDIVTMSKEKFMLQLIKYKEKDIVSIKQNYQVFKDLDYIFYTVYKFVIVFPDRSKIIIKNVLDTDIYFPELEAMTGYKTEIELNKDDTYPDFPRENDGIFVNKLYTKKYK